MLHAFSTNRMTQEVSYKQVILSAQVEADEAHMPYLFESF